MSQTGGALDNHVASPGRLLRSRLGRRLLTLFVLCALVPTCAVALLSFQSVTGQLTRQSRSQLAALVAASGKTVYDRLLFLESDLRRQAPKLMACQAALSRTERPDCDDGLLYAAEGVAAIIGGELRPLSGEANSLRPLEPGKVATLIPGQSTLLVNRDVPNGLQLYLVHRVDRTGLPVLLAARVSPGYLWGPADSGGLPEGIAFAVVDSQVGTLLAADQKGTPGIEWGAGSGAVTAEWTPPATERFQLPTWRVVLSEPRAAVIAPLTGFTRSFPLVLALALLAVVGLSFTQIKRSLAPLVELGKGTLRVAAGDFHTPVQVNSGDEFEALGGAFNSMSAKLERQFAALETAAEIDRAILSTVDTASIAQTVLDRLPEVYPCAGLSLTVLGAKGEPAGTTWMQLGSDPGDRTMAPAQLAAEDVLQSLHQPEWMVVGDAARPLPPYLAHFAESGPVSVVACPLHHGGELLGVLALRDCGEQRSNESLLYVRRLADRVAVALSNARMMDQVRVLAFYDTLTKLPNRVLYRERLGQAIGRARQQQRRVAVCSLDLDHFSRINDTLGHAHGDRLVQEVAARLLAVTRQEGRPGAHLPDTAPDQVARLGGDEFTVILTDLGDPQEAVWAARRLLETFQQPFRLGSEEVFISASVGIAVYPEDGMDTETLHKHADVALSHAKSEGRNTVELYSASMNGEALGRMQLERELRRAVEHGEFTLWYQPIVDLRSRRATGAEALVRWQHPDRGMIPPGDFIGLCEESGLIVPLGEWTLRTVCAQIRAYQRAGLEPVRFSVNLSARQLRQRGIVRTVQDILEDTGVAPGWLAIELTESLLMEQGGTTERRIRELAELGLSLAIDDFGTGYSSLSYLKNFPVSTLKIDRSFIVDITTSHDAAAITTAIIALAKAMDLDVVAEGVETKEQAAFLRSRGCQKAQGYLVGRPTPLAGFTEFLQQQQRGKLSASA